MEGCCWGIKYASSPVGSWEKNASLEIFLLYNGGRNGLGLGLVSLHLKVLSAEWCII